MRLYDHDGELVQSLRAANRWNNERLYALGYATELSRRIQLTLVFAGKPLDAYDLATEVQAPACDVLTMMCWLEQRGWIRFV